MAKRVEERLLAPPGGRPLWEPGDPGYEPVEDPPTDFFHVIAAPPGTPPETALVIAAAYAKALNNAHLPGRRYLVNATGPDDARAQVELIERQLAESDPLQRRSHGPKPWAVLSVAPADEYLDAGRDSEPAQPHEAIDLDYEAARRRRERARSAGIA